MTKTRYWLFVVLALIMAAPFGAKALMVRTEDSTYIPKDQVVSGSLFAAGSSITIEGKVQGDVFCAGQSILINGTVDGDVICAGQSITVNGTIGGSVRAAGNSIVIAGKVARNVMVAGANLNITPQAQIGWDLQFGSAMADLRGKIGRDIDGGGASATIAGNVGRNVYLTLDDNRQQTNNKAELTIAKDAKIGGMLSYRAKNDATIEDGASIKGEVKKLDYKPYERQERKNEGSAWAWFRLFSIFSSLILGLILVSWLRRPLQELTDNLMAKPWSGIGWGLLFLILTPIAAVIICFTVIGIPVAILGLIVWGVLLYLSKLFVAIALGRWVFKRFQPNQPQASLIWPMVVGVVIVSILFAIPVLGWILCFIATLWGMGAVWQYARMKS